MSSLVSAPPPLPLINDDINYNKHVYELTLYKLNNVPDPHYSDDDKDFYINFDAIRFKPYLFDTIDSREIDTLKRFLQ